MKISLVQYNPEWENKIKNMEKIHSFLKSSIDDTNLIIFPEMTLTGFTMNSKNFAEKIEGESFSFFSDLAVQFHANLIAGIIEAEGENHFNTLVHIDSSGKLKAKYQKVHPFSYSSENQYYSAGNIPVVTEIDGIKTGLSICYDLRFPELYRFYGKERVELIVNIANWPDTRISHWKILLKARAIENQCFVVAVNRVGKDVKLNYTGSSNILSPMGIEKFKDSNKEEVLTTEINLQEVYSFRKEFPFLEDITLI